MIKYDQRLENRFLEPEENSKHDSIPSSVVVRLQLKVSMQQTCIKNIEQLNVCIQSISVEENIMNQQAT